MSERKNWILHAKMDGEWVETDTGFLDITRDEAFRRLALFTREDVALRVREGTPENFMDHPQEWWDRMERERKA